MYDKNGDHLRLSNPDVRNVDCPSLRLQIRAELRYDGTRGLPHFESSSLRFASPANAVDSLGEVDDLEVRRERADQGFGFARRQSFYECLQLVIRSGDRGEPGALDALEERVAALLAQHVADERAQRAHIVTERDILRRELGQEPSAGVNRRAAPTPQAASSMEARPSPPTVIGSPFCSTSVALGPSFSWNRS